MSGKVTTEVYTGWFVGSVKCVYEKGVGLFDAGYWSDENAATETAECEYLIATTKDWKQRKAMREAPPPRGRMPRDMSARDQMERKLLTQRGRKLYRLRGQTVEPVFGQTNEHHDI